MTLRTRFSPKRNAAEYQSEAGFSLIELLLVFAVTAILTTITIINLSAHKRAYAPDDEATQIVSYFREAHQRALSQRQTQRVTIDRNDLVIRLMDEGLLPGGDEVEIIRGKLNGTVSLQRPTVNSVLVPTPPSPYNYNPAPFTNGVCQFRFQADGSVLDAAGNSISATFFFTPLDMNEQSANLVRGVTLFGPSGSTRTWKYDSGNNTFFAGGW